MAKRRGCFCWVCGRIRPNERFSGKGRQRHVCRECARLPARELECAQAIRNIGGLVGYSTLIKWKHRQILESKYLQHPDERVRECALRLLAEHALEIARRRAERLLEEEMEEQTWASALAIDEQRVFENRVPGNSDDEEIPF